MADVTEFFSQIGAGDPAAANELFPLVYDELRRLAAAKLACEKPGHTLQTTALVHEAYLRLVGKSESSPAWESRVHFFMAAAEAMRRILVDSARRKATEKRGGGMVRHDVHQVDPPIETSPVDVLALDEALTRFAEKHPDKAQVVKLRFFGGLTVPEIATATSLSTATIERHWRFARAWLARHLDRDML